MPKRKPRPEPDEKTRELLARSLPSEAEFTSAVRKVLTVSKEQSDQQLADYRAANHTRREHKANKK